MRSVEKTGHLAWCALVALMTAREDGRVITETQENLFILRWFTQARKQRRFSRDVATDIDWIISQGNKQGVHARLRHKLQYLQDACSGRIAEQTDMFRFTCAMETAQSHGWVYCFLDEREWCGKNQRRISAAVNGIYLLTSSLDVSFNDDGLQLHPVPARITGETAPLKALLDIFNWTVTENNDTYFLVTTDISRG